jgi:signal transduction histidine kinase
MLQAGIVAPDRLRQAIDVISRNTMLQARLIEDILDVSRIVSGKLEIEAVPVMLAPLIDAVVSGMLPAAQAKNVEIVKAAPADLPVMEGDPKRLHQVLGNARHRDRGSGFRRRHRAGVPALRVRSIPAG